MTNKITLNKDFFLRRKAAIERDDKLSINRLALHSNISTPVLSNSFSKSTPHLQTVFTVLEKGLEMSKDEIASLRLGDVFNIPSQ